MWLMGKITSWLNKEIESDLSGIPLTDFERLCEELRQGDVLLVEGHSRVSHVIKSITFSPWTHSAFYIGRLDDIKDGALQNRIAEFYTGDQHEQLIIEAILGEGTVINSVSKYENKHLRICRPKGLSKSDRQRVITFALAQLGYDYDVRHLLDLARFLLPYSIIPRRWRSTLFISNAGEPTKNLCSYMLGDAFGSVNFPILPVAERSEDGNFKLYKRNPRLFTPKDFDYSPYFDIIKYPFLGLDEVAAYRALPWDSEGIVCNIEGDCFLPANAMDANSTKADNQKSPTKSVDAEPDSAED